MRSVIITVKQKVILLFSEIKFTNIGTNLNNLMFPTTKKEIKMINQSNANGLKGISRAVLIAVITFVLSVAIFATTAFAGLASQYNVEIVIDSNEPIVIATNEKEPIEILAQANITLEDSDKLDISSFRSGEGGIIKIDKLNSVNIDFGGAINTYDIYEDTVGEALDTLGIKINESDKVNYALTDPIQDGMVITVRTAKAVTLNVDGESTEYAIYQGTVADLLELAQVTLGKDDYTKPALDSELKANMKVNVYRVEYKTVTETETVKYKTKTVKKSSMDLGDTKTVKKGVNGEDRVSYKVKYVNGKETDRTETQRVTIKEPVTKVVNVGTKVSSSVKSNGVKSKNGYTIGQKISGRYTHYCACGICGSGTGVTASGKKVYNGMPDPYYIACNWLPMGSVVEINGKNYTVVDRGGSGLSTPGRVDIFTPEGHAACYKYGTGSCTITIVRLGW